jgi:hypothetical protein
LGLGRIVLVALHIYYSLPNEMKHSTLCIVQEKNKQHPNLQLSEQKTLFLGQ